MKTFYFIIAILFFYCPTAFSQTYSNIIDDQEIYDFLDWLTVNSKRHDEESPGETRQVYYKILKWDTTNFVQESVDTIFIDGVPDFRVDFMYLYKSKQGMDTLFTPQDKEFIFKQFNALKDSVWHKPFSGSVLLTQRKQKATGEYLYAVPLFSLDRRHVIVRHVYYCGSHCAYGGYYIYRKLEQKKWELVKVVNAWMS